MEKIILDNGLTVIMEYRPTNSIAVEVAVKVGSNLEDDCVRGISHFIEHMLFEGTKTRSAKQIANEIESIGGEINAATYNERTVYYVYAAKEHIKKALDVLADIIQNPLFDEKAIEKERKIILDEINLIIDDPKIHMWNLFKGRLFRRHPCRHPISGTKETVSRIIRRDIIGYYNRYYLPNNMVVSVAGNFDEKVVEDINKLFRFPKGSLPVRARFKEPKQNSIIEHTETRPIEQSYIVLGYKTAQRAHKDSYAIDIIETFLGKGQSSRLFDEIRTKKGLAYIVGACHDAGTDYGVLGLFVGTDKKNIDPVKGLILKEVKKLSSVNARVIEEAKNKLIGSLILENEDMKHLADFTAFWECIKDAKLAERYIKDIKSVTKKDVLNAVNKYFSNHTFVAIRQA